MNDDTRRQSPERDDELERRLEAHARARLAPDPARIARMRAQLLADVRERPAASLTRLDPRSRRRTRWLPALLAAGLSVVLVGGIVFAGSQAGGPLYPARLWLEQVTLPADPASRLDGELDHLQTRLDEAAAAVPAGNGDAVQAALDAYRATIDRAVTTAGEDLDRTTHVGLVLGRHRAVLAALADRLPPKAAEAIERAIDRTEQKITDVQSRVPGASPGGGPGSKPAGPPDKTTPPGSPPDKTPKPPKP